ncbi:hypothetical protein [Paenibacillus sp. GXUN7292]|uniref:hypothetical protein n=1 Tax=Paenibacillus sp. GXUN7292 TaxID=3422499 RepID=UPI003D7D29A6
MELEQLKDKVQTIENVLFRLRTGKHLFPDEIAEAHQASQSILKDYVLPLENKE